MNTKLPFMVALLGLAGCGGVLPTPSIELLAHPGFDTWRYPGDELMNSWRGASPYRWIGYYLPSPCHRDASFSGKRPFLTQTGWGIAVLYVGQQTFEGEPPAELTESTLCSSILLTAERGEADGRDAVQRAAVEGFPAGTTIFLDIERMQNVAPAMISYYESWLRTVIADGRYRPGTYAHLSNAAALYTIAQRVVGPDRQVPFWVAGGSDFSLGSRPEDVGYRFAAIWQGVLDTRRTWGGRTLVVDENVAGSGSPSAPTATLTP
ncbi:MAG: glycoside hydrolase domain-containing protein [Gemmatimonadota bacterium]